jgi:DNA polymerase-3 subunit gamma/tau
MARIFARELNCSNDLQEQEAIAQSILNGNDLDVIEIDGASNRGVQEARDLIASAGLAPTRCQYRIYIIDEVHMLTTPAFNALLKTMEEPPSHVKFILCTTEPHKVPATIQSRCQRFDFKTISSFKIGEHLKFILEQEGIQADPEVISEVARLGDGSMRDALSLLDRLLAAGASSIKLDEMEDILGLPSQTLVMQLCQSISTSNMTQAFESSDALLQTGVSLDRVLEVVALTFRNALVSKVCGADTPILQVSDHARKDFASVGETFDESTLTYMISLCDASSRQVRRAGSGRALFDATIARLCMASQASEAGGILLNGTSTSTIKKPESTTPTPDISWETILSKIESTPGLKNVGQHLLFSSLQDNRLVISISESGRESIHYILGQRQRIEQLLTKDFGQNFDVVIETSVSSTQETTTDQAVESAENDELVQIAKGLFGGTIVNVQNVLKGES